MLAPMAAQLSSAPVYSGDFADPFVLRVDDRYYAYATNAGGINVEVVTSSNLASWERLGDALPSLPSWAGLGFTWAPVVLSQRDRYVLYYTVRHAASGRQAISVATGDRPEGPFNDVSRAPLIFQQERGGSIDPSPFVDVDGRAYLLWKSDDNAIGRRTSLWICRLDGDGLSFAGKVVCLLRKSQQWEEPLIEAPSMVRAAGGYYLFYSANWWESSSYAVGYGTGRRPAGRFNKMTSAGPWVSSRDGAAGPGGQEFFTDTRGALWMAYHAWQSDKVGYAAGGARALWVDRVEFVDGHPRLGA